MVMFPVISVAAQTRIAVLPFDNRSGASGEWLRYGLPLLLSDALAATGKVSAIGLDELHRAATENDIRSRSLFGGAVTPAFAKQAIDWQTAYALVGWYDVIEDSLWLEMRLIDLSKRAFTPAVTTGGPIKAYTDFFVTMLRVQDKLFSDLVLHTTVEWKREDLVKMNDKLRSSAADLEALKTYLKSWLALKEYDAGLWAAERQQFREAIVYFESARRLDEAGTLHAASNLAKAHVLLANGLSTGGLIDSAIVHLTTAISADSTLAEAYYNLGNAYQHKGDFENALPAYSKAISRDSSYMEAHLNIGYVLLQQGKIAEAIVAYSTAQKIAPDNAKVRFHLGNAYDQAGQYDKAKTEYTAALRVDSTLAGAHLNLGILLSREGDATGAKRHYNSSLTYSPDDARAHRNLGILLMKDRKETRQAIFHLEKTLEIDPSQTDAELIRKNIGILKKRQKKN
jgi:tetratricopeptide (TPR) repeat protein